MTRPGAATLLSVGGSGAALPAVGASGAPGAAGRGVRRSTPRTVLSCDGAAAAPAGGGTIEVFSDLHVLDTWRHDGAPTVRPPGTANSLGRLALAIRFRPSKRYGIGQQ